MTTPLVILAFFALTFGWAGIPEHFPVIGGLIPLGITLAKAYLGKYTWASYGGVRNVAIYWHFLDVVWVVMFSTLLLAG